MKLQIKRKEKEILRDLAKRVRDISLDSIHEKNIQRWKAKNALKKDSPIIICNPPVTAWNEMIPDSTNVIKDRMLRGLEAGLRRTIYRWEHITDDWPITSNIFVPLSQTVSDWMEGHKRPYTSEADHSAAFVPCINGYDDIKKMKFPELLIDRKASERNLESVGDLIGDILTVVQGAPYMRSKGWGESLMDELVEMRGLEQMYMDVYNNPEFIHEVMDFMMKGIMGLLDQYEKEHALFLNNRENGLGSLGLGYTDELPKEGFNASHVTTKHLWGYAQTQEFSEVSPDMFEEFVIPYQSKLLERFGLNCYGCCEANDKKWGIIKKYIPNLRALSVSPFAKHEIAADQLKDRYVYVWKPHAYEMIGHFDEKFIRDEMKRVFEITKECHVVASLMDTQTLYGEPQRLGRWVEISKEVALEY